MNIVVDINHPAHVHYFKNFIREMGARGHRILITASDKEITYDLLNSYRLPYKKLGSYGDSPVSKMVNLAVMDIKMYTAVKSFKPDLFLGFGSIRASHVSKFLGKPCIAFDDTEHSGIEHLLYGPFTDAILTPACFCKDMGNRQVRYDGFIELAYLHGRYYSPDPGVLKDLGILEGERFAVVRFVSWSAGHDINQHGIENKLRFVKELEKHCRVLISSEGRLPAELEGYAIRIKPERIHDLLYYACLYAGEGATMATEAALLGTPSVYISSLAGTMGNFSELEHKYGLVHSYSDTGQALKKAVELLENKDAKKEWRVRREQLLDDKIDVTSFMVRFIESYPEKVKDSDSGP